MISGLIVLWYGIVANIPVGYALCNGSNGTPDLRNKFIVGAGGLYAPAATGGNSTHTHVFTADPHAHALQAGMNISSGADYDENAYPTNATGTTDAGSSLPPYHALCYIMKL